MHRGAGLRAHRWLMALGVILAIGLVGPTGSAWSARASRTKAQPAQDAAEQGSALDARRILDKLDELAAAQERILKRLDDIMEELKVVKIRATLRN